MIPSFVWLSTSVGLSILSFAMSLAAWLSARRRLTFRESAESAQAFRSMNQRVTELEREISRRAERVGRDSASSRRVDRAKSTAVPGPTLISVPSLVAGDSSDGASTAAAELSRRFAEIWELSDRSVAPEAIAEATDRPVGEVELILALRRQVRSPGGPNA